jgi:hypothetical protein
MTHPHSKGDGEAMKRADLVRYPALVIALASAAHAGATIFKCADAAGRVSYQDTPCPATDAQSTVAVPAAPSPPPRKASIGFIRQPAPTTSASMQSSRTLSPADVRGPLDAWSRFTDSLRRGDKASAMKELTPSARERYDPVFDALMGGTKK